MLALLSGVVAIGGAKNRPLAEVLLFCAALYSAILLLTYPQIRALVGWRRPAVVIGILGVLCAAWLVARNNLLPEEPDITLAQIERTLEKVLEKEKRGRPEARTQDTSPPTTATQLGPPEPAKPAKPPLDRDAPVNPQHILRSIFEAPILLRQQVADGFEGTQITCKMKLYFLDKMEFGRIELTGTCDRVPIFAIVRNSTRFTPLREGAILTVSGPISEARGSGSIVLSPATVVSIESYGGSE